jgi:outer membrane protein assembly factor BamB/Leucine-rich repeat (LRR) protein
MKKKLKSMLLGTAVLGALIVLPAVSSAEEWSWTLLKDISGGIEDSCQPDIDINQADPFQLYAFVFPEGVLKSIDSGKNWKTVGLEGITSGMIATSPINPDVVFIRGSNPLEPDITLWKSIDGGITWRGIESISLNNVAFHPVDPSKMFAVTQDWLGGTLLSTDGGETWSIPQVNYIYPWEYAFHPTDPSRIWVSYSRWHGGSDSNGNYMGVAYSTDGGYNWSRVEFGRGWTPISLVVDQKNPAILYAASPIGTWDGVDYTGVWKSTDGGLTWTKKNTGLINTYVVKLAHNSTIGSLYAATPEGVFFSGDGAESWTKINDSPQSVNTIALSPDGTRLYAVTSNGIYVFAPETTVAGTITITAPNGSESLTAGTTENITWTSSGVANVKIEYSPDNGTNWSEITASTTASSGSYAWAIPAALNSTTCKVRITDAANATVTDISDAVFTIAPMGTITVTSPNGGDKLTAGTPFSITWTFTDVTVLHIDYSTDDGANWNMIEGGQGGVNASNGSFEWTLPTVSSTNCLVRITDSYNGGVYDESDELFSIAPAAGGLADTAWPMRGQNPQHTGRGIATVAASSTVKWKFQTGGFVASSPAIGSDGTVYVGSGDNYLYAVKSDGTLKWKFQTENIVGSSPAIGSDGTVYVGSEGNYLYAIKSDGTLKWKFHTGVQVRSSPAIGSDGTVYVGSFDNYLYAVTSDGTLKWKFQTNDQVSSSPAIDTDGRVYVGSNDNYLYAIKSDGTLKWKFRSGGVVASSPAIGSDGTVYVGSQDNSLYAVTSDGTLKWKFQTGGLINMSSPAIGSDGTVYVGSFDSYLYAVKSDGTLKWKFQTNDQVPCSPAIGSDGTVYVGSQDNFFYAVKSDGLWKWKFQTDGAFESSPAIGSDGTVYVGSLDSYLYAFAPETPGTGTIPDPNLEAAIRTAIGKPTGPITEEDLAVLTMIDASELGISDITGIEHCVNLQTLDLLINQISDISPLSGLTNLQYLNLGINGINDLSPLSNLTNLQDLTLAKNQISDLSPLSSLTNLEYLNLDGNQISDISPLSGLTGIYWLELGNNQISDISPLVSNTGIGGGDSIDLRGNPLSTAALSDIQELQNRGANIQFDEVPVEPDISLSALSHDFENVRVGASSDWTLTVSNVGTTDLSVTSITSDNPDFKVDSTSFTVPSGNNHAVTITFSPTSTGPQSAAITVTSNDSDENTVEISVSGTGTAPEITVTAPNGGDVWEAGSAQNVTWDSQDIAQIRIEYSNDNGTSWNTIIEQTDAVPGLYPWDIPDVESSSCLVRITDTSDDTITDDSDSIFAISRTPFIQVTAPMESDLWMEESAQTIEWKSSGVSEANIEYSTDGGGSWNSIMSNVDASTASYDWQIPEDESDTCIIRISDVSNSEIRAESGIFEITTSDNITITSPTVDDKWSVKTEKEIKWEVIGVANVSIEVSYDDGNTWAEMLTGSVDAYTGSYSWMVPDTPYDRCRIRIADTSRPDKVFFITEPFEIIRPEVKIAHIPQTEAQENEEIIFTVTVTATAEVESVILYYNKMGESESIVTYPMELTVDNTYSYTLPVGVFNVPGIEYHIVATDINGIEARSPVDVGFYSINAWVSDVNSTNEVYGGSEQTAYRMISIPLYLNSTLIVDQLVDTLPPGKMETDWRLFRYPDGSTTPQEYPDIEPFLPGRAFWLITVDNFVLNTSEGKTVPTDERFRIDLNSGWNDIANPWMFDISWDNIENPGNANLSALYTYEGQWSDPTNPPKIMEPWKGYAIKNLESSTKLIFLRTGSMVEKTVVAQETEVWRLSIRASAGEAKDTANYLGVRSDAKVEWDSYDHVEPPPIGKYVSVNFPHNDWEKYPFAYTVDFRPPEDTITWDFNVKTNIPKETVVVQLSDLDDVPDEYNVRIYDLDMGSLLDAENSSFSFVSGKNLTERHFRIVVSTTDEPGSEEFTSKPKAFITASNYPNPFNPQTTIQYELAEKGNVTISIFNSVGQKVVLYDAGQKEPGKHEFVFDASNLTTGIYFYRVDAENNHATGKMLYMK